MRAKPLSRELKARTAQSARYEAHKVIEFRARRNVHKHYPWRVFAEGTHTGKLHIESIGTDCRQGLMGVFNRLLRLLAQKAQGEMHRLDRDPPTDGQGVLKRLDLGANVFWYVDRNENPHI
jgi:hypothetical protein